LAEAVAAWSRNATHGGVDGLKAFQLGLGLGLAEQLADQGSKSRASESSSGLLNTAAGSAGRSAE
jgi:hypothetical protein